MKMKSQMGGGRTSHSSHSQKVAGSECPQATCHSSGTASANQAAKSEMKTWTPMAQRWGRELLHAGSSVKAVGFSGSRCDKVLQLMSMKLGHKVSSPQNKSGPSGSRFDRWNRSGRPGDLMKLLDLLVLVGEHHLPAYQQETTGNPTSATLWGRSMPFYHRVLSANLGRMGSEPRKVGPDGAPPHAPAAAAPAWARGFVYQRTATSELKKPPAASAVW